MWDPVLRDGWQVKLDNLIQANPKLLLVATTLFPPGTTQATLPFQLRPPTAQELGKGGFHINITIPLKVSVHVLALGALSAVPALS